MTTEKMTIHKALSELKTIDDRIIKSIRANTYVLAVKHSAEKINGVKIDTFKDNMKSGYQKTIDLIARRDAMKRAVVLSNANTKVKVGNKALSVAEAIEAKNHGMEFKKTLLQYLSTAYGSAQNEFNKNNDEALEKKAEKYILDVIAAQPKDSKMSIDSDAMKALRKTYIENNTYDLVDPLGVAKVIEALDAEINEFNAEVDAALSVSNALTVIEFDSKSHVYKIEESGELSFEEKTLVIKENEKSYSIIVDNEYIPNEQKGKYFVITINDFSLPWELKEEFPNS